MPEATFRLKVSIEPDEQTPTAADCAVIKADDAKRYLLTVAYPAMKADVSVAADGHRDFAPPDVIEMAAWNFMRKGARLGLWHQDGHDDAATTVESYIYRGPDWTVTAADGSEQLIKSGDWLLGVICSPETWSLYQRGEVGGVSPQGGARRRIPSPSTLALLRS